MSLSGKIEFLAGQLALLTAGTAGPPGPCSCHRSRLPPGTASGVSLPWRGLDTAGWRLQWAGREQVKLFWSRCFLRAAALQWGAVGQ
jgi:hypothetical protein